MDEEKEKTTPISLKQARQMAANSVAATMILLLAALLTALFMGKGLKETADFFSYIAWGLATIATLMLTVSMTAVVIQWKKHQKEPQAAQQLKERTILLLIPAGLTTAAIALAL